MTRPRPDRELDACGIGFVADAQGRSSRAIVAAALSGLAHVKHRGAVAADARSGDGSGVLVPIPPAIFGEGHGVITLFFRGADPRPAVEAALADEGLKLVEWRWPETDDDHLGDLARGSKPSIVQAIITAPTDGSSTDRHVGSDDDERVAYRLRRRIGATAADTYVASCSFRMLVYKGLAAADELGHFYVDLADERFEAWADGRTGYPLVDAGMRQLRTEGWLHNRVRMVVASFLVKDLHIDWTRGARHFMEHLVDGDVASNQHGWQWVAGTGTDAAPYFRVFNPVSQSKKFDPDGAYIRRWVPELAALEGAAIHEPWTADADLFGGGQHGEYPDPIVDHATERDEALARYDEVRA